MLAPITVGEVMKSPVKTVSPDESARSVATRLSEEQIGSLVVCDNGEPVGIVTDSDVSDLVSDGYDPNSTTAAEFMASPLVNIREDKSIQDAAKQLREHDIKRLPVVDEHSDIVGIVTTTDLTNYLPHLIRRRSEGAPDQERTRQDIRADTLYEDEDWEYRYFGTEADINVGDTVEFSKTVSEADVEAFAEASGDTNRLHLDAEYAEGTRFGERIAHGTLATGIISAALARLPGMVIYLSQDVSYLGPVPLGDRVTAECEVVEKIGENRFRLNTTLLDGDGETVIDGEAAVISEELPPGA